MAKHQGFKGFQVSIRKQMDQFMVGFLVKSFHTPTGCLGVFKTDWLRNQ
jgi:hypothetical protein